MNIFALLFAVLGGFGFSVFSKEKSAVNTDFEPADARTGEDGNLDIMLDDTDESADDVVDVTSEPTVEVVAEPTPEVVAEPMLEVVAEPTFELVVEPTLEVIAEPTLEVIAEPTPVVVAEPTPEVVAEPELVPVDTDSVQTDGTPVILILGQSNAGILGANKSMTNAVTTAGGDAIEVTVAGGGQSVSLADGAWNLIEGDGEDAPGESYTLMLETVAQIYAETPDAYIANVVWVQGEADAHGVKAANYYDAAFELFTQMREDLGYDFPISIVGLSDYQNLGDVGRSVVLDAQQQLAADMDNVYFVDTNAIIADNNLTPEDVMRDNLHYTADFYDHIADGVLEEPAVRTSLGLDDTSDDSAVTDGVVVDDLVVTDDLVVDDPVVVDDIVVADDVTVDPDVTSGINDMPRDTPEEIDAYVTAVISAPETHLHGDDSGKMTEHMAALDLVGRDEATHIAVRDGDWDDPATWHGGEVPGDDARVLIPEGVHVDYATVSDARIFTLRVDGELEFATDTNSSLTVDTLVATQTSTLTIGTQDNPVQADVNVDIIFANNGPIDVDWDPMLLSRGMVAHGQVSIHGTEKDSHEKVVDDPMAGDTSVTFSEIPTGWTEGDTIVIAGTHYEGYYDWDPDVGYEPSEDEVRTISSIDGNTVYFDEPLEHDHDTPRADLKTSVANYTRNVSFETEDADMAETGERGHVMFMHNDNVDVRYAEFLELGRTDKSDDAFNASEFDNIASDSNVQGRYSLHLHRAGTENGDNPAIVEGNAVFGSPGWGFVHHDSHALLTNNASFDTFGAGYVAETGNETGEWSDNIAILSQGISWADPKGINAGANNENDFDMGRSGDGFWFQGRMVGSSDNIAASVHNGFVYFHRGPVAEDGMLTIDSDTTPFASLFHYDDAILPDEYPIMGFNGNETFAAKTGVYILKSWYTQDHAVNTVLEDFTAWSVRDGADLSYTGHYTLIDFDVISREGSDLRGDFGSGIIVGNNTIDLTVVDATIEGFATGVNLDNSMLDGLSADLENYTFVNPTFIDVGEEYRAFDPDSDTILEHDELPNLTPDVELDGPLVYNHTSDGGDPVYITGTRSDSLGESDFVDGPDNFMLSPNDVRNILEEQGYYTTSEDEQYFVLDVYFSDRLTGDIYIEQHPVFIAEGSGLGEDGNWWFRNVVHNGVQDFDTVGDTTNDAAELWASLVDGQLVLSDDAVDQTTDNDLMVHDMH